MSYQFILPLLPMPSAGNRDEAPAVPFRVGVTYHPVRARTMLHRCVRPDLPFGWTLDPYIGCPFTSHQGAAGLLGAFRWAPFDIGATLSSDRRILVKRGAIRTLEQQIAETDLRGQSVMIGTTGDPYQPIEQKALLTRGLLAAFRKAEGLDVVLETRSSLVLRDLDLLAELDTRHSVRVRVPIPALDDELVHRLEPWAPPVEARLETLRQLAALGLAVEVVCRPLMVGINDAEVTLRPLFEEIRFAGARDVRAVPLDLRELDRRSFFGWLGREFPELVSRYRRLYGQRHHLDETHRQLAQVAFERLRLAFGFPSGLPGRG